VKTRKQLLVTGTMRVGTKWTMHALRANGVDVRHEGFGEDGTVSWFFSIDAPSPYNLPTAPGRSTRAHVGEGQRSDYEFETIIHLVRNPLKVIGSMVTAMLTCEQQWLMQNGMIEDTKPKLLRMMQAWNNINAEIEKIADYRVRLEDWTTEQRLWDKLGRRMKRKLVLPAIPVKNASRGIFKAKIVTVEDLVRQDVLLTKNIIKRARKYGYSL
jgi:hypothetical protein